MNIEEIESISIPDNINIINQNDIISQENKTEEEVKESEEEVKETEEEVKESEEEVKEQEEEVKEQEEEVKESEEEVKENNKIEYEIEESIQEDNTNIILIEKENKIQKLENSILIFDLDGTLCASSFEIEEKMVNILMKVKEKYNCDLAINGGGTYEKICKQIGNAKKIFKYIFAECGSVVYENDKMIQKNNLLNHKSYNMIQKLMRYSMKFISETSYDISGHMIDVRNGLVYISMVGMQANEYQREMFMKVDKRMDFRKRLLIQLNERKEKMMVNQPKNLDISIKYGGQVGISLYPTEWDKVQCLKHVKNYKNIHYFGDRHQEDGNDYIIINHEKVIGHKINSYDETYKELEEMLWY